MPKSDQVSELMSDAEAGYAVIVADGHLDGEPAALRRFRAFLQYLSATNIRVCYILGDLFTLWLGAPRLQLSYQPAVVEALQVLADQGIRIIYVEGNRDYFLSPHYAGHPFAEIASEFSALTIGGQRLYLAHGDLVNSHDTQYQRWRRFSRNRLVYTFFTALPGFLALRLAQHLERRFRNTNQRHKAVFPAETCHHFAHGLFSQYDAVILGHFHHQYHYTSTIGGRSKALYVLPAWKDEPVYLEISRQGACAFKRFRERP